MKKVLKLSKPAILLASVATSYLIFKTYRANKDGRKNKKIKWNWEVEFKKNTSEDEKIKTLLAIDMLIIDYLYKEKYFNPKSFSLNITNSSVPNMPDSYVVGIFGDPGDTSTDAVAAVKPRPHPHFPQEIMLHLKNIEAKLSNSFM